MYALAFYLIAEKMLGEPKASELTHCFYAEIEDELLYLKCKQHTVIINEQANFKTKIEALAKLVDLQKR